MTKRLLLLFDYLGRGLPESHIMLDAALQCRHVDLGDVARLALSFRREDARPALQCSDRSGLTPQAVERLFRCLRVDQHGVEVHRPEGSFRIGEDVAEARRHLFPLLCYRRVGAELRLNGIGQGFGEQRDAGDHWLSLLSDLH